MDQNEPASADEPTVNPQDDLREQLSRRLLDWIPPVTAGAAPAFPPARVRMEGLDAADVAHLGRLLVRLLAIALRDGRLDARSGSVADLHRSSIESTLSVQRVFALAYLIERIVVDQMALDDSVGATSARWPLVEPLIRRASFDVLAAYAERAQLEPSETAVIDRLTTLYTKPVFDAVLAKEVERAGRFGYPISLMLFDIDRLSVINREHGYGVGDKVLERLGILIHQYFRQYDWVARHAEDAIAVLLTRADADRAAGLAERVRATVEERLGFTDRTDRPVAVTISAAVINVDVAVSDIIDPGRLTAEAEAAVERAKRLGRNRVERVDGYSGAHRTVPFTP